MTEANETPTPNPINELNTACERITYALDRISRVGWHRGGLRKDFSETVLMAFSPETGSTEAENIAGPACLLGSLVTDAEFAQLLDKARTKLTASERRDALVGAIYDCKLPGLHEAVAALGFDAGIMAGSKVWQWNDDLPIDTGQTAALERLSAGKQKACS